MQSAKDASCRYLARPCGEISANEGRFWQPPLSAINRDALPPSTLQHAHPHFGTQFVGKYEILNPPKKHDINKIIGFIY